MEHERFDKQDVTPAGVADFYWPAFSFLFRVMRSDFSQTVAADRELHRTIAFVCAIEMDPSKHHFLKQAFRWFHVPIGALFRPIVERLQFVFVFDRDDSILMPGNRPIRVFGFIERDQPDRHGARDQLLAQITERAADGDHRYQHLVCIGAISRSRPEFTLRFNRR